MTPDGVVIDICLKQPNGAIELLVPGLKVEIEPAHYADGRLRQGFQHVRIMDGQGRTLHDLSYNAEYYERLYDNDFTDASVEQNLSDWDFFLALKDAVRYFSERAESGRLELSFNARYEALIEGRSVHEDDLIYSETGKVCQRSGMWASVDDLKATVSLKDGELMPQWQGNDTVWVWSREV